MQPQFFYKVFLTEFLHSYVLFVLIYHILGPYKISQENHRQKSIYIIKKT
jgi:hypothetical protein